MRLSLSAPAAAPVVSPTKMPNVKMDVVPTVPVVFGDDLEAAAAPVRG